MPSTLWSGNGANPSWLNGLYVRPVYRTVPLTRYIENLRRVIVENQATEFDRIEDETGQTLKVFNAASIFFGQSGDINSHSVFIEADFQNNEPGNYREDLVTLFLYVATNTNDLSASYRLNLLYLTALQNILDAMPGEELVWREQREGEDEEDYFSYLNLLPNVTKTTRIFQIGPDQAGQNYPAGVRAGLQINLKVKLGMDR